MKAFFLRKEYQLTIGWFFATSIGFVLGEVFLTSLTFSFVPLSLANSKFDWFGILLGVAAGIATGLAVGVFQWIILRNCIHHSWLWIIATPLGMASGIFIGRFIVELERYYLAAHITSNIWANFWTISYWISVLVEGIMIGLSQLVVIRKSLHKPWIWVIANGVGWALANSIESDVLRPMIYPCCGIYYFLSPISESVIYGVVGIFFGIFTGAILLWLLRQNNSMVQNAA
jgi:hypothetical protein